MVKFYIFYQQNKDNGTSFSYSKHCSTGLSPALNLDIRLETGKVALDSNLEAEASA